jgi:chromosome segregation ATPase
MEYYLNRINIVFIALVGALCVWQWSGEKRADGEIEKLRQVVATDERHVAAQDQAIRGANEDIDEFKKVITSLKAKSDAGDVQIRQQKARIFTFELDSKRHDDEADIWKKTIAAYKDAVASRDGNIHVLLDQRQQLIEANKDDAAKANKAVLAYNDLAAKYADLIGHYNDLAKRYQAEHPPAPDSTAKPST